MDKAELINHLQKLHPYPKDVFIPPTPEQWEKFHKVLKDAGLSSGGFVGAACRIGYEACIYMINQKDK